VEQVYRRRLPHWHPAGASIFLTWRLYGSLPHRQNALPENSQTMEGQRFLVLDRQLDSASSGPTWLKDPNVAACVADALSIGEKQWELYELFAWVVMSNHVHVLLNPHKALREVTRAVKSTSARQANRILGRSGFRFWQEESYDHWVRDAKEFDRIVRYIEANPLRARLVERVEDWPWSSGSARFCHGQVGDLPHGPEM
jgi:putative transposase